MTIRQYQTKDCKTISELFFETVHTVNAKDYSAEQLSAWVQNTSQLQLRKTDFLTQKTLIAEVGGKIVGFGSMDQFGCLDMLYVHKDYQHRGIGTALCDRLEQGFSLVTTHASITAKPFFEKRGYTVIRAQEVERHSITLKNYVMQKKFITEKQDTVL